MAGQRVKRRVLVAITLVLVVSMAVVIGTTIPRQYAFIDDFAATRDVEAEKWHNSHEQVGPHWAIWEAYRFKAPSEQVLAAITKELIHDGWRIDEKDEFSVLFSKGKDLAFFEREPFLDDAPDVTCTATLARKAGWFRRTWEKLKRGLGWN